MRGFEASQKLDDACRQLPKWRRDYLHDVHTFVGAPEVEELIHEIETRP